MVGFLKNVLGVFVKKIIFDSPVFKRVCKCTYKIMQFIMLLNYL